MGYVLNKWDGFQLSFDVEKITMVPATGLMSDTSESPIYRMMASKSRKQHSCVLDCCGH